MPNKEATIVLPLSKLNDLPLIKGDIIAVDGGCQFALKHHLDIHQAIGDFDSLSPKAMNALIQNKTPMLQYPRNKDLSDAELAFQWALSKNYSSIRVVGFAGGRLDHYQAIIQALFRIKKPHLILMSGRQTIQYLDQGYYELVAKPQEKYFSIFTFSTATISLTGCQYPLSHHPITEKDTLILSNQWRKGQTTILTIHTGDVLLFRSAMR